MYAHMYMYTPFPFCRAAKNSSRDTFCLCSQLIIKVDVVLGANKAITLPHNNTHIYPCITLHWISCTVKRLSLKHTLA